MIYPISFFIYVIGTVVSAVLLYIYAKNYRHIKSHYNIGLIIFALLFLIDNIISLHQIIFSWPYSPSAISHVLLQDLIDVVGLSALLYISWK